MSAKNTRVSLRSAVMGVLSAACVASVHAAEPSMEDLVKPESVTQVGVGDVSDTSAKYGEYNGLKDKGLFDIANIDWRGGGAYDSADATRWRVVGNNLGLNDRDLSADYALQGVYKLHFGASEITHWISDSFQTPYQGVGSSVLTLPSTWLVPMVPQNSTTGFNYRGLDAINGDGGVISNVKGTTLGTVVSPTAANLATLAAIQSADDLDFHTVGLRTWRERYDVSGSVNLSKAWSLTGQLNYEQKSGLQAEGALNVGGSPSSIIPNLIDTRTTQTTVKLGYSQKSLYFALAYYGSIFENQVPFMTFQSPANLSQSSDISNAPNNQYHQVSANGGWHISPSTQLVANLALGTGTQNQSYINDGAGTLPMGLPATSLHGEVDTTTATLRLTSRPVSRLNLTAAYKFDSRVNTTPVNTYLFYDTGEAASGASLFYPKLGSNINIYQNRDYSKKLNQLNMDADYSMGSQGVKLGYEWSRTDRWCHDAWINCADAPKAEENTGKLDFRFTMTDKLNGKLGVSYAARRVDYDPNAFLALVPEANAVTPGSVGNISAYQYLLASGYTGFGPVSAYAATTGNANLYFPNGAVLANGTYGSRNAINELPGLERYYAAGRDRWKGKSLINWDVSERSSLQASISYIADRYPSSSFGLISSRGVSSDIDWAMSWSETQSSTAYITYERSQTSTAGLSYGSPSGTAYVGGNKANTVVSGSSCVNSVVAKNANAKIDPCLDWFTNTQDRTTTFGLNWKDQGIANGKVEWGVDAHYSFAMTNIGINGGSYSNNPLAVSNQTAVITPAVYYIGAQNMPDVLTRAITIGTKLQYHFSPYKTAAVGASTERFRNSDYVYQGMQLGSLSSVMPTFETAPNFNVTTIAIAYSYRFH